MNKKKKTETSEKSMKSSSEKSMKSSRGWVEGRMGDVMIMNIVSIFKIIK